MGTGIPRIGIFDDELRSYNRIWILASISADYTKAPYECQEKIRCATNFPKTVLEGFQNKRSAKWGQVLK